MQNLKVDVSIKMTIIGAFSLLLSKCAIWLFVRTPFLTKDMLNKIVNKLMFNKHTYKYKAGTGAWKRLDMSDRTIELG